MDLNQASDKLANIRRYVMRAKTAQDERMDLDESQPAAVEARLDQALKSLQDTVAEQRRALDQLRESSAHPAPRTPSADPGLRLGQLRTIKAGYDQLTNSEPILPSIGSPIPALLATQVTTQKITGSKEAISESQTRFLRVRKRLEEQERSLQDNNLITEKLNERIVRLRQDKDEQLQKSSIDIAHEQVDAKQVRKKHYEQEIKRYHQALHDFIDEHLAAMIAAEELGGPTVGDMLDVNEEMLGNGFSAQGKPKTASSASKTKKNQMRLDRHGNLVRRSEEDETTSKNEAAACTKQLLEELLDALLGQDASGGYVTLQRDSAAARFFVRAKVAQFHPKDARRLRLIDFARTLDD